MLQTAGARRTAAPMSGRCPHGRVPYYCRACNGGAYCPCGVRKGRCPLPGHGGSELCCQRPDGVWNRRDRCLVHGGVDLCACGKQAYHCSVCPQRPSTRPVSADAGRCALHARRRCRACAPLLYLQYRVRKQMVRTFAAKSWPKPDACEAVLGCSWQALLDHILAKCEWHNRTHPTRPPMSVANCEIDHIKPTCTASTPADLARLWHYTNLQPLFHEDNNLKNRRWLPVDDEHWAACILHVPAYHQIYMPYGCALADHAAALAPSAPREPTPGAASALLHLAATYASDSDDDLLGIDLSAAEAGALQLQFDMDQI